MIQKIIKVGSSIAVTVSKKTGYKAGDSVSVAIEPQTKKIVITPHTDVVDTETVAWAKKFIKRYRPALKALARK